MIFTNSEIFKFSGIIVFEYKYPIQANFGLVLQIHALPLALNGLDVCLKNRISCHYCSCLNNIGIRNELGLYKQIDLQLESCEGFMQFTNNATT